MGIVSLLAYVRTSVGRIERNFHGLWLLSFRMKMIQTHRRKQGLNNSGADSTTRTGRCDHGQDPTRLLDDIVLDTSYWDEKSCLHIEVFHEIADFSVLSLHWTKIFLLFTEDMYCQIFSKKEIIMYSFLTEYEYIYVQKLWRRG